MVGVPELCGDEEVLSLDETIADSLLDTLANLLLVTVVTSTVKESVTGLDGLIEISVVSRKYVGNLRCIRCQHRWRCRPSIDRIRRGAWTVRRGRA